MLHSDDSNYVFTTEGHILTLGRDHIRPVPPARRKLRKIVNHQCPAYTPLTGLRAGLVGGIRWRPDMDYARELVGVPANDIDQSFWSPTGWCDRPKVDAFVSVLYQCVLVC